VRATHPESGRLDEVLKEIGSVGVDLVDDLLVDILASHAVAKLADRILLQVDEEEVILLLVLRSRRVVSMWKQTSSRGNAP
jgi:hypothetical protein